MGSSLNILIDWIGLPTRETSVRPQIFTKGTNEGLIVGSRGLIDCDEPLQKQNTEAFPASGLDVPHFAFRENFEAFTKKHYSNLLTLIKEPTVFVYLRNL